MASFEFLAIMLTGLGLIVTILYYTSELINANITQKMNLETRQIQLFMQVLSCYQEPEFHFKVEHEMLKWEWNDYDHFIETYGVVQNPDAWKIFDSTMTWIDGVGILVKYGHLNPQLVNDTLFAVIETGWEKFGPIIKEFRKNINYPQVYTNFEYLYNVIKPLTENKRNELQ